MKTALALFVSLLTLTASLVVFPGCKKADTKGFQKDNPTASSGENSNVEPGKHSHGGKKKGKKKGGKRDQEKPKPAAPATPPAKPDAAASGASPASRSC
jgi:hypothetical protein